MNYKETTEWLFSQLPMYQNQGASAYKNDLSNIKLLDNYLKNPHQNFPSIHIGGTNGKGSTSSLLASVLQESGYKVGLYTSPHLKDYRERIKINGQMIPEESVVRFIEKHRFFFESNQLSFFEMSVGLAFDYFSKEKVDIAIIEVGLGGRLDATNIITPILSIITNIGLDHTAFLGNTLDKIAFEKAGIIKENVPVVIGETTPETKKVFLQKAKEKNTSIYFSEKYSFDYISSDLKGNYQKKNKRTVQTAIKILQSRFKNISKKTIENGFAQTIKNTGIQGRWQTINTEPKAICDTAHNHHGLKEVLKQLKKESYRNLHFVLGFVNDKNLDEILPLFPKKANYYFTQPKNQRALDVNTLQEKASKHHLTGKTFNSVSEAYKKALEVASNNDLVYVGGSTFIVAEIL